MRTGRITRRPVYTPRKELDQVRGTSRRPFTQESGTAPEHWRVPHGPACIRQARDSPRTDLPRGLRGPGLGARRGARGHEPRGMRRCDPPGTAPPSGCERLPPLAALLSHQWQQVTCNDAGLPVNTHGTSASSAKGGETIRVERLPRSSRNCHRWIWRAAARHVALRWTLAAPLIRRGRGH